MHKRISSTASWPCTTANALPLESRRSCGTTPPPPTPRLGSSIWAGKAGGEILHCFQVPASERTDACPEKHHEGENLADGPDYFSPARLAQFWFNEKPILHYLQVVSNTSISVGCGIATYMTANFGKHDILSCRYYPQCGPECGGAAYVRAIEYFDKVLAIDPHDVHALTGKGAALDVLGNHTGAIEYCDKAKAIKSAANDTSFRYFIPGANNIRADSLTSKKRQQRYQRKKRKKCAPVSITAKSSYFSWLSGKIIFSGFIGADANKPMRKNFRGLAGVFTPPP